MSRIIVKNLPDMITKEKLHSIFSEKGFITDLQLKYTKHGVFRKFAFIGFQKPEMAEAAIASFNKSFIYTSRIQVEICAPLGDPNKPRAWSRFAPENLKRSQENTKKEIKEPKIPKLKTKIKDPKVLELIKNHEDDQLFKEFLDVNAPEVTASLDEVNSVSKEDEETKINKESEDGGLANKDISDSEYLKLKTGVDLNLKEKPKERAKVGRVIDLFEVKLKGLPPKVKKSQIKEFLEPLKPYSISRPLKCKGVAYCGFKTQKEMKQAVFKNMGFLDGNKIFVTAVKKKKNLLLEKERVEKQKTVEERLKGVETVAESGRIFIRNLPYTTTEEDLKGIFEKYGDITEIILPIDPISRKPKGYGLVTFLIPEHGCKAFNELSGSIFQGRMLHLVPALPKEEDEEEKEDGDPFKKKKAKKEKNKSGSSHNWNTFFIGENAVAEAMAATYNTTKENVLDDKKGGTSVRLALGETQIIHKMKEFLEENNVCLEAFENMFNGPRSKTVILVKNLPFGTKAEEIRERFCKFGELKRVVLPPSGVAALVEFIEPFEAKTAFRRVAYSKFKHVPLYLEWAPEAVFKNEQKTNLTEDKTVEKSEKNEAVPEKSLENIQSHVPVEGTVLFVKNLNFSTEDESLRNHFSSCGTIVSATVARKRNPANPGKTLSMGYGFVQFTDKESADKALKTLQFSSLDDHRIELKRSNRTLSSDPSGRKTSKSNNKPNATILVRNIPFQATQKEVTDLFKVFGEIKSVRLPKKMVGTGVHRGFCFVEYNTVEDAKRAFAALSLSTHFYGRRLVLEWAATDDEDVATLREKTAKQFITGTSVIAERKKNFKVEEKVKEEDEEDEDIDEDDDAGEHEDEE